MSTYTQANRSFALTTPLGPDALLLAAFRGREALSELFSFHLDLLATAPIPFDDLLTQPANLRITAPGSPTRFIHGIFRAIEEADYQPGPDGPKTFIRYEAELVPSLWRLSLRTRSRIWQQQNVPQILKQILHDDWQLDVSNKLTAAYPLRDYCVQYQESDLNFVLRLMEDEGIWFCFDHSESSHTLILGDTSGAHPPIQAPADLMYDPTQGTTREQGRISTWRKRRERGVTKIALRDFHFQKPISTLDAIEAIAPSVAVGSTTVKLPNSDESRRDVFPAGFARHFDRIQSDGQDQPEQLDPLFSENKRMAELWAEAEAAKTLRVMGTSDCGHLVAGSVFNLTEHFSGNGAYVLVNVEHSGDQFATWLQGDTAQSYSNSFEALPLALPFRPQRVTPKPNISGTQTAKVVGPPGLETYVDRYGRVKIKFPWDPRQDEGTQSSCWVRVAQVWAGRRWGAFFWPRIRNEVVVTFENGDPDRPLIVGSVYNDFAMPPFELPANVAKAGIKSCSMTGDSQNQADPMLHFNGIVFHDSSGEEHTEVHSERDSFQTSERSHFHNVNGVHRVNVSERQSVHVGCIPTSGSGTGEADTPSFYFSTQTDTTKKFGVNFTSVVGLNQTNTLGAYGCWTVGDYINIVNNPLGMITDGLSIFTQLPTESVLPDVIRGVLSNAGALFGGTINLNLGSLTGITYGTQISVSRSGRAAITNSAGYLQKENPLALLAMTLGTMISLLNAGALVWADAQSYASDDLLWEVLTGVTLGAMALLVEVEIIVAIRCQVQSARDAVTAAAKAAEAAKTAAAVANTSVNALELAKSVESMISAKNEDQNKMHAVSGNVIDHSNSRIVGTSKSLLQYSGTGEGAYSAIQMSPESLSLTVGAETGAAITLSDLEVSLGYADSKIRITKDSIVLRCGANEIRMSALEGITLLNGPNTLMLNPLEGFVGTGIGGIVRLNELGASMDGLKVQFASGTEMGFETLTLSEIVAGIADRVAGLNDTM
jgi:type VI secretion system secreted protein VgrG